MGEGADDLKSRSLSFCRLLRHDTIVFVHGQMTQESSPSQTIMRHVRDSLFVWFISSLLLLLTWCITPLALAQSEPPLPPLQSQAPSSASTMVDFDHFKTGPITKEFTPLLDGFGKEVSWEIRSDPAALSGTNVLAQTSYDQVDYRFPMLVYNNITAKNVRVAVQFKPVSGQIDQVAGVIVRFQDPKHFYVVRANALDNTVQLSRVVNDEHHMIAKESARVATGQWHYLEVTARDDKLTVFFDGQQLFDTSDETFSTAGKVGLSTKSDGVIIFDDLQVTVLDAQGSRS